MTTRRLVDPTAGIMAYVAAPSQMEMQALWSEGLSCLWNCEKIQVKERFNLFEAIASTAEGTNMKSRYRIFSGEGEEIFFGVEKADLRSWPLHTFFPDCAPWDVDIYLTENKDSVVPGESAFKLRRPWTFTCCCCNRPEVDVMDVETGLSLGSIRESFARGAISFAVQDPMEKTVMRIDGRACEWGLCCPLPFGPCAELDLQVRDVRANAVGNVRKKMPLCCSALRKEHVEDYKVDFANVEAPEHKALLMALAILIDSKFFHAVNNDEAEDWQWLASE